MTDVAVYKTMCAKIVILKDMWRSREPKVNIYDLMKYFSVLL